MVSKSKHEHLSKEEDISKHLPRAFYFAGLEAEQKVLKNTTSELLLNRLLKQIDKMPEADV